MVSLPDPLFPRQPVPVLSDYLSGNRQPKDLYVLLLPGKDPGYFGERPAFTWNPLIQTGDGAFGVRGSQFDFNISGPSHTRSCGRSLHEFDQPCMHFASYHHAHKRLVLFQ